MLKRVANFVRRHAVASVAVVTGGATAALLGPGSAMADTTTTPSLDFSGVTTNLLSGLSPAATQGLIVLGVVAGIMIGIALFRKITGAKKAGSA